MYTKHTSKYVEGIKDNIYNTQLERAVYFIVIG